MADDEESLLMKRYAFAENRFMQLCDQTQLPFLDKLLYLRYFRNVKTEENYQKFLVVINALVAHKAQTLAVIQLILQREQILNMFRVIVANHAAERLGAMEAKTHVLQLLYGHQQITLQVVEAIQEWRGELTRPFPFHFCGVGINYFFKILAECRWLDSALEPIFPTQLAEYPLASNLSLLHAFYTGTTHNGGFQRNPRSGVVQFSIQYPLKVTKRRDVPSGAVAQLHSRLTQCEQVLLHESALQRQLLQELTSLHAQSMFLPLLLTPTVVPNSATGVLIKIPSFLGRLATALDVFETKLAAQEADLLDAAKREALAIASSEQGKANVAEAELRAEAEAAAAAEAADGERAEAAGSSGVVLPPVGVR